MKVLKLYFMLASICNFFKSYLFDIYGKIAKDSA